MIIVVYGKDEYRSRERMHTLRDAFASKFDAAGHNTVQLDGETLTSEILQRHLRMQGFFASKRCISIDRLCSAGRPDVQTLLAESVESVSADPDIIVMLWESLASAKKTSKQPAAAKRLWSALTAHAKLEEYTPLEGTALRTWILQYAKKKQGSIAPAAADKLAAMAGPDLWSIATELEKLIHYRQGEAVRVADVEMMVSAPANEDVFRLTDAIGQRNRAGALKVLEEQLGAGAEPLAVLGMIAWHVKNLLAARSVMDSGVTNSQQIASTLHIHPFVAQKAQQQAARFTMPDLQWMFSEILNIDRSIKNSRADARAALTLLITKATRPKSV